MNDHPDRAPFFIDPRMRVVTIAAVDINGIIGDGKEMPWPAGIDRHDMRRFSRTTGIPGTLTLMGSRTYLGLPAALHGRRLAVLTSDPKRALAISAESKRRQTGFHDDAMAGRVGPGITRPEIAHVIRSAAEINGLMYYTESHRLCVAGGGDVYRQAIEHSRHVLLTIMPFAAPSIATMVRFPSLKFDGGRFPDGMTVAAEFSPDGALLLSIDIPSSHVRNPAVQRDDMTREEIVEIVAMALKIDRFDAADLVLRTTESDQGFGTKGFGG